MLHVHTCLHVQELVCTQDTHLRPPLKCPLPWDLLANSSSKTSGHGRGCGERGGSSGGEIPARPTQAHIRGGLLPRGPDLALTKLSLPSIDEHSDGGDCAQEEDTQHPAGEEEPQFPAGPGVHLHGHSRYWKEEP